MALSRIRNLNETCTATFMNMIVVLLAITEIISQTIIPHSFNYSIRVIFNIFMMDYLNLSRIIKTAVTKKDFSSLEFETHNIGSSAVAHGNAKLYILAREI